jgi:HK97 family phage portal protein
MELVKNLLRTKAPAAGYSLTNSVLDVMNGAFQADQLSTLRDGLMVNPHLYSVVSFQASKAAMIQWKLYEVKNNNKLKEYTALGSGGDNLKKNAVKAQALKPLEDHELLRLIDNPNEYQGKAEFLEFITALLDVTGNAYIWKVRSSAGGNNTQRNRVVQLFPLNPAYTTPYRDPATLQITEYQSYYQGQPVRVDAKDVIHIKQGQINFAEDTGRGSYESAGLSIQKSNNLNMTEASMMKRGGLFGLLSPKGDSSNPYGNVLRSNVKESLELDIKERAQNPHKAGSAIIPPVEMSWQNVGLRPQDMNFERARLMSLRDICNCANLPAQLFNDSEASTYQNMEQARQAAYTDAILPKMYRIRDAINSDLLEEYKRRTGRRLFFDFNEQSIPEMQQDMSRLVEWLSKAYWLTGNEKRAAMNYEADELPEFDSGYYIPTGLTHTSQRGSDDVDIAGALGGQQPE